MKQIAVAVALTLLTSPTYAQLGKVGDLVGKADKAKRAVDSVKINEKDERAIGEAVSGKLIDRFGIYQDPAVAKYVTLVGTVLAQASARPNLDWRFIVLDSEGVNAYAAPGGLVHITKGALGMIKSESELAGVLGHEILHVTAKHTIHAMERSNVLGAGTEAAGPRGGLAGAVLTRVADFGYDMVFENKFGRDEENDSDKGGMALANKVGYSPIGISDFLNHLSERNKTSKERNGLFASHPQTKERLDRAEKTIKADKLTSTARAQPRYANAIKFNAKPVTEITPIEAGAKGMTSGGSSSGAKKEEPKKEEPKKSRFGGIAGRLTGGKQAESKQASAGASGRAVGDETPDKNAPGGANKTPVRISITPAEIAEFKKGIA
jgi:beta-barrel assembly-enhancing protease